MSASAPASLVVDRLTYRYAAATRAALDDVSLSVAPGERLGLLGPNGAGKSTLMRIVCGFLPIAGDGRVRVADLDVRDRSQDVRRKVGYMPELVPLYPELRVHEHLAFRAAIKELPRKHTAAEIDRVAAACGLTDVVQTPIGKLSRGYRQRVGIADALLGAPGLLVLDEPTVGLDPNQIREMRAMLRELGGAQTLVFSSHILAEVEALCDRVVILSAGRVVLDAAIADAIGTARLELEIVATLEQARTVVTAALATAESPESTIDVQSIGDDVVRVAIDIQGKGGATLGRVRAALGDACLEARLPIRALVPGRTRLESRFAEVTGGQP
jgi:ABC-2 type transport system ATP-binding protein